MECVWGVMLFFCRTIRDRMVRIIARSLVTLLRQRVALLLGRIVVLGAWDGMCLGSYAIFLPNHPRSDGSNNREKSGDVVAAAGGATAWEDRGARGVVWNVSGELCYFFAEPSEIGWFE